MISCCTPKSRQVIFFYYHYFPGTDSSLLLSFGLEHLIADKAGLHFSQHETHLVQVKFGLVLSGSSFNQ